MPCPARHAVSRGGAAWCDPPRAVRPPGRSGTCATAARWGGATGRPPGSGDAVAASEPRNAAATVPASAALHHERVRQWGGMGSPFLVDGVVLRLPGATPRAARAGFVLVSAAPRRRVRPAAPVRPPAGPIALTRTCANRIAALTGCAGPCRDSRIEGVEARWRRFRDGSPCVTQVPRPGTGDDVPGRGTLSCLPDDVVRSDGTGHPGKADKAIERSAFRVRMPGGPAGRGTGGTGTRSEGRRLLRGEVHGRRRSQRKP